MHFKKHRTDGSVQRTELVHVTSVLEKRTEVTEDRSDRTPLMFPHRPAGCILVAGVAGVVFLYTLFVEEFGLSKNRRDDGATTGQDEASSHSWRPYPRPNDATGRTTGQ